MNTQKNPRKVVSIPVRFASSAPPTSTSSASASATRIQKVFRGFLVRKNLKKVVSIKKEVDEAERRVMAKLETIRNDPKERLKANEALMGLLFKLDSVQGVGHGVRECRKAVIKKAIVLQEIIDGCDVSRNTNRDSDRSCVDESNDVMEISDQGLGAEDGLEKVVVLDEKIDTFDESPAVEIEGKASGVGDDENINQDLEDDYLPRSIKCDKKFDEPEMEEDEEDYCMVKKVVETKPMGNQVEKDCYDEDYEDKLENCKNRGILEKMMEENEKMMNMMKQLSEQHQAQTQMLSLLSHRVEQLEKAFVREVSRKKSKDKKKKAANGLDFCPGGKKR